MKILSDVQDALYEKLVTMTGAEVVDLLTDYHGMQLLDDGFAQHMIDEGHMTESDFGWDEEDDEEDSELTDEEREADYRELCADIERDERDMTAVKEMR